MEEEFTQEQYDRDYEQKQQGLEAVLGKMHDMVGHSIVPFYMGGSVDLYYFLNHIDGTGIATMELLDLEGNGPLPNELGTYELVAFTREKYSEDRNSQSSFDVIAIRIRDNLTAVGGYSYETIFNPGDTYESVFGEGDEKRYMILDNYVPENKEFKVGDRKHHLLLCMEIFKSEMDFAIAKGSDKLFKRLKKAGRYPFSDLNRQSVV